MLRPSRFAVAASVGVLFALHTGLASANGRFPATDHLVIAPSNPNLLLLRTTFGFLVSQDRAANFDWVCEKAFGVNGGVEDPAIGITAGSAFLAGTFEGLAISQDTGCGWAFVGAGLAGQVVVDVVVRPNALHSSLALTNKYASATDAGSALFATQVFSSDDDAKTWAPLGTAIDPTLVVETIEVAASDPNRIYVSGARDVPKDGGTETKGFFLASTDKGTTWTEYPLALNTAVERAPFIAAVDPKNALRVYVRTQGAMDAPSRLLVTDDGGMTFRSVFQGKGEMFGFALSPDGSKIYLGGSLDGLQVGSSTALTFAKKSSIGVQCLATTGTTLYACSSEASGFVLGASEDDGATFTPKLHLATLRGPLSCPANSSESICLPDWPAQRDSLGVGTVIDAGPDADAAGAAAGGPDGGNSAPPPPQLSAGGCSASDHTGGAVVGSMFTLLVGLAFAARRKRMRG